MQLAYYCGLGSSGESHNWLSVYSLSAVHFSAACSGSSSINGGEILCYLAAQPFVIVAQKLWHKPHQLKQIDTYPPPLHIPNPLISRQTTRDGVTPNCKHHKLVLVLYFALSPYILSRLMKKEKLSFPISWQLFRLLDQIILAELEPISSASWFFIFPNCTPFPTLNGPFLS